MSLQHKENCAIMAKFKIGQNVCVSSKHADGVLATIVGFEYNCFEQLCVVLEEPKRDGVVKKHVLNPYNMTFDIVVLDCFGSILH